MRGPGVDPELRQSPIPQQSASIEAQPLVLMSVDAVGGVWPYAMALAAALGSRGYRFVFAALGPPPDATQRQEAGALGELSVIDEPLDWMAEGPGRLTAVGAALSRLASHAGAHLIHLNAPSQAARLETDRPIISVSHSCLATWWAAVRREPLPPDWYAHKKLNLAGFEASHAVVAPSASHAQAISACYGEQIAPAVVHNAIAGSSPSDLRNPVLFAAGRWWDDGKNGAVLAAAAPFIDWPMVVAGALSGPEGQHVAMPGIQCLGAVPQRTVLDHTGRAEIVVSPSLYEPFGLAALEGAAGGASLLLADIPTYRELWDGAAEFFSPRDPGDLAAKANGLIRDPKRRSDLRLASMERARSFSPERQAAEMSLLYSGLLSGNSQRGAA